MKQPIQIGLMGLGTVGSGVVRLLRENAALIASRAGRAVFIKKILVRDKGKPRQVPLDPELLTDRREEIVGDPDIGIVIEVMGGERPAREYLLEALGAGKSVVTANKELIAKHGPELFAAARESGVDLCFEASVAGGIPIIKPLKECLSANRIRELLGIINGTTNYMLTRMTQAGRNFHDVLDEAQRRGYAEPDPTSDIEGYDAAYKLSILASIAFETRVSPSEVYTEGIAKITPEDIQFARELGCCIKLLAVAKEADGQVEARVHPTMIPLAHPLAAVNDVFNAVFVRGDAVGELMFFGRGAGQMPTASAILADVVDAIWNRDRSASGRVALGLGERRVRPMEQTMSRYYVHLKVVDRPGVLASIAAAFGHEDVSLASVIQKGRAEDPVSLVFVTHEVRERNVRTALEKIELLPVVREVANVIRVEDGPPGEEKRTVWHGEG